MGSSGLRHLLERYTRALEQDPDNPKLRVEIAEILHELDRDEEAKTQYETAARLYVNLGLYREAAATCARVLTLAPDHQEAQRILRGLRRRGLLDPDHDTDPPLDDALGSPTRQHVVVLDPSGDNAGETAEAGMPSADAPRPEPISTAEMADRVRSAGATAESERAGDPTQERVSPDPRPGIDEADEDDEDLLAGAPDEESIPIVVDDEIDQAFANVFDPADAANSDGVFTSAQAERVEISLDDAAPPAAKEAPREQATAAVTGPQQTLAPQAAPARHEAADDANGRGVAPVASVDSRAAEGASIHDGLFVLLPPAIATAGIEQTFSAGETIYRQGETTDDLFLLVEGEVRISRDTSDGEVFLGSLDQGSFFGEIALLGDGHRYTTVSAASDTTVLTIPRAQLTQLAQHSPNADRMIRRAYRDRLRAMIIKTSELFTPLHDRVARRLLKTFKPRPVAPGEVVIRQGDGAPGLFLVLIGTLAVSATSESRPEPVELANLGHGDFFGEISLLRKVPCTATVTARDFCQLLHLSPEDFDAFTEQRPRFKALLDKTARRRERENKQHLG